MVLHGQLACNHKSQTVPGRVFEQKLPRKRGSFCLIGWSGCVRLTTEVVTTDFVYYSTITQSLPLRPNTSGEYISSALAGGTTNLPGVVARAMYVYS